MENHSFQADAKQILKLVTHSIYSEREVFLRELLSNSSDALDKARFISLQNQEHRTIEGDASIRVFFDETEKTITIEDDGIGMSREEIVENLGTIAQSGTKRFAEALEQGSDVFENLIGQFGVGFYAAFMVADKVSVETLSIKPDSTAIRWESDGGEGYSIGDGVRDTRGTTITLHVKEDAEEFLSEYKLKHIIKKHSDFISWPIMMAVTPEPTLDEENEDNVEEVVDLNEEPQLERVNQDKALWLKSPSDVTEEDYNEFFKHVTKNWEDPLCHVHIRSEGTIEFNAILYVPKAPGWQLDNTNYKVDLKLYQRRVKVIEHANDLLPRFLRFVCGVVDSPSVSLNVSREILQNTPAAKAIQKQLTKKVLRKLAEFADENPEAYNEFWEKTGHMLKEGLADYDAKHKNDLLKLFRCKTTTGGDEWRSLAQIKADLKEGQEDIWYLADINKAQIAQRPVLEGFQKREWEVMLLSDPVDEWMVQMVREYDETPLKSVMHGELPEEDNNDDLKEDKEAAEPLVGWLKELFNDDVEEVRLSSRLTESPSIFVSQEGAMSANMEKILRSANQEVSESKRVLEINPSHPMVKTLSRLNSEGKAGLDDFAWLLLDHAEISEGKLNNPQAFAARLQGLMEKAAENL